jgi:hypothetical protein
MRGSLNPGKFSQAIPDQSNTILDFGLRRERSVERFWILDFEIPITPLSQESICRILF